MWASAAGGTMPRLAASFVFRSSCCSISPPGCSPAHATVAQRADPLDLAGQDVSRLQEPRWVTGPADARRRAGIDDVAGEQRQNRRQLRDQARHVEHHVRRTAALHLLAVDGTAQLEIIAIA